MAYADQQMSGNRIVSLIIVGLIHLALGYALVTGLAYEAVSKVVERVTTIDVPEDLPPEPVDEPPPPEDPVRVPPPVAPPPPINIAPAPPPIVTQPTPPPPAPIAVIVPPAAPPAPPPPRFPPKNPQPRGKPGNWATPNDYPRRALREDRAGTTGFRVTVNAKGRVESCSVTRSSGHSDLDQATCKYITRRARFRPATNGDGAKVSGTWSSQVRWQIPD